MYNSLKLLSICQYTCTLKLRSFVIDLSLSLSLTQTYASMKPLASWARDLVARVDHFAQWALAAHPPKIFWLSAFTFPTGFLTAVLQSAARQNNIPVDSLSWDFQVLTTEDSNITGPSKVHSRRDCFDITSIVLQCKLTSNLNLLFYEFSLQAIV